MHEANIEPFCTLFHWDLPQALEDKNGGWTSPLTAQAFADYAHYTASQLGDRIGHWMTINEFGSYIDAGYGSGEFAPGRKLSRKELMQTRHNAVYAHGLAVQAVRAGAGRAVQVGLAEDISGVMPAIEDAAHIRAAEIGLREENAWHITAIFEGHYTDYYLQTLGADAPVFTPEEMKAIASPIDFLGINIYTTREAVPSDAAPGYQMVDRPASYPHMALRLDLLQPACGLLDAEAGLHDLARQVALHHRERVLVGRRAAARSAESRRSDSGLGPRPLSAQLPYANAARRR